MDERSHEGVFALQRLYRFLFDGALLWPTDNATPGGLLGKGQEEDR